MNRRMLPGLMLAALLAPLAITVHGRAADLTQPTWMHLDRNQRTVTLEIIAAKTAANNHWNFNGYHHGDATIVVPKGYKIIFHFTNQDASNPHSLVIDSQIGNYPMMFEKVNPAFPGAMTSNPAAVNGATKPNKSETIQFVADRAGEYAMVCYYPFHASQGMWIRFTVSAQGQAGLKVGKAS